MPQRKRSSFRLHPSGGTIQPSPYLIPAFSITLAIRAISNSSE